MESICTGNWLGRTSRNGLWGLICAVSAATAQVNPTRYQLCEPTQPSADIAQTISTNYRYSPATTRRSFQGYSTERCDGAWLQSPDVFEAAAGVCQADFPDCAREPENHDDCREDREAWNEYDYLGDKLWSNTFTRSSAWVDNPLIAVHSGVQGVEQWTRHRWWGYYGRYDYLGIDERPFTTDSNKYPKCYQMAYLVGLFNGVWNTDADAELSLKAIKAKSLIGSTYQGARVGFHLFYNQTGCSRSGVACIEDIAETFIQRSTELDGLMVRRWEYFWEQASGQADQPGSLTDVLRSRVINGNKALIDWLGSLATATLGKVTAVMAKAVAVPPTAADTATHVDTLVRFGQQGWRAVLVGHSQGNLFANAAYDGYLARARQAGAAVGQDTGYVAAKIVHVAPATAVLKGPQVLTEADVVINALRASGTPVAPNTLSLDMLPRSAVEWSGHRLVETYLDPQRKARAAIQQLIFQAMDGL